MTDYLKPTEINKLWSATGDIVNPGDAKIAQGWIVEPPPRQTFNYLINRQDLGIAYLNQKGIAEWDSVTEYISGKSYTQGSDGKIYRSIQTGTNKNPVTEAAYWVRAFDDFDVSYDKGESDAKYLHKANNLSDLSNAATARSNLDVYSKSEADSRYVNTSGDDSMAGNLSIDGGSLNTAVTTFNLIDTTATTVNFARAATTLTIGATSGTTTVRNNLAVTANLTATNGTILSGSVVGNLFNTVATTVNLAGAATTVNIGSSSGNTNVNNNLVVSQALTAASASITNGLTVGTSVTATSFSGNGANLTSLNAGNLSTGTVAAARLSGTYTINISGTATTATNQSGGTVNATSGSFSGTLQVNTSNTSGSGLQLSDDGDFVDLNTGYGALRFTQGIQIYSGNKSGTPVISLKSNGEIIANGDITAYSDERLKDNIETITSAVEKVKQLRGVYFDKGGKRSIGVIAQETQKVFPEVVNTSGEYLSVAYGNLVGALIEAIKEQQLQIDELRSKIGG